MKEIMCPFCGRELHEDGRCYNIDCTNYDPVSQYFDNAELARVSEDYELAHALELLEDKE